MGAAYTRQSSSAIVDGGVIEASDINAEFDQVLAAFAVTSGHTHDGTAAEGGPITKLLGTAITIGDATAGTDIAVTFDGETADGVLTWMEDEDYFKFSDDILMNSTERLNFGDTGTYIFQSTDGQLDIVADTEVQIAATTIDINGAVDISGALTLAGTTLAETISDTVGAMVTSNTESGITVAYDDADNTLDFTVGTLNQDTTGTAATVTGAAQTNITSLGTLTALTVDNMVHNGDTITMTPSASDTATMTAATNGAFSLVTVDAAAAAANIQITADGTVDIDSAGVLTLDSGAAINIEPAVGSAILLDGTISVDAGVVTGATSITSTAFVGALTGNASGTAATVTTAAQSNITSLGTLTTLTVDNVITNGATIGHTSDTDLITLADGIVTVAGEISVTTLDIGGTNVTSDATELNLLDGKAATNLALIGIQAGTGFTQSVLVGSTTTGTLNNAEDNTGVGFDALKAITSGDRNTAVGSRALETMTQGMYNTAIGTQSSLKITSGQYNTSLGTYSYIKGTNGDGNTIIGYSAGTLLTGEYNIFLGKDAGDNVSSGDGNVMIGRVNAASATGDKQLKIADGVDGSVNWISGDSSGNLTFKRIDTGDDNPYVLTLQTGETDIAASDILGSINFQAPDEGTGTDAILVAAGIDAVSEGDFSSSNNATKLSFKTAASEAAAEKMSLSSTGLLTIADDLIVKNAGTIGTAADSDLLTMGNAILTVAGEVQMTTLDIGGTNVTSTAAELNYSDLATLGTSAASKVLSADANNLSKITGAIYIEEATLSFDATQDWDVRASPVAKVTLTANVTFDAPSNPTTGQFISIVCIQDGTGSRTIAWNAVFEFATDTAPTATTTASLGDMFNFRYNGAKWLEVGRNLALTLA
jgi:hypothetical protein